MIHLLSISETPMMAVTDLDGIIIRLAVRLIPVVFGSWSISDIFL